MRQNAQKSDFDGDFVFIRTVFLASNSNQMLNERRQKSTKVRLSC